MKTIDRDGTMGFKLNKAEIAALTAYASGDKTRYNLSCIAFDTGNQRVMATDGHRLTTCQAMMLTACDASKRTAMIPLDCMIDVGKRLKAKGEEAIFFFAEDTVTVSTPMGDATYNLVGGNFPPIDQVIPKYKHAPSCGVIGFNAFYMADIALVGKACESRSPIIRFELGPDTLSPALMKIASASRNCEWTIVLMPARLA
jgi:hypothetical protein